MEIGGRPRTQDFYFLKPKCCDPFINQHLIINCKSFSRRLNPVPYVTLLLVNVAQFYLLRVLSKLCLKSLETIFL